MTGASRGIGRCIALGLGEAGWTVYVTSRTIRNGESDRPGSVTATAEEVTRVGGLGIAMPSDHRNDTETAAAFRRVEDEQGRLDLLVNNATSNTTDVGPPEDAPFNHPFGCQDVAVQRHVRLRTIYPLALVVVLGLGGCGGQATPTAQSSPSPSPLPTVSTSACASAPASTSPPATPAPGWPTGGAVPAELAGSWALGDFCLWLTGYTYDFGAGRGNVVVNGAEIDFFNGEACGKTLPDGVGRWKWTVNGNMLTLSLLAGDPCRRGIAGTWTKFA